MASNTKESSFAFLQKELSFKKGLNDKSKVNFYMEFASMLEAGVDMQRALDIIIQEQSNKNLKLLIADIQNDIISGHSLSDALKNSKQFSPYEYQSIRIGEETGKLKMVLDNLTAFFEDKVKLKRQLISVFSYPGFVVFITIGILYFMLNFVVPMFEDVFKQFGQELPWLTQKILYLSNNFSLYFGIFVGIILILVIIFYTQKDELWYKKGSTKLLIKIPVFGPIIKKIYVTRFCQSMSLLTSARIPLVEALDLVIEMINFYPIEEALESAQKEILKGNSLSSGLSEFSIFDNRLISLVTIAEEINQLDITFERLTKQNNDDIEHRTKVMGNIIQPVIILIVGSLVGLIMVGMYMPMFNLSNIIQ